MTILVNGIINWIARQYQLPFLAAMAKGIKRAVLVFHRRSGKTITLLNYAIGEMTKRSGITVYHTFPTYAEAVKVVWEGQSRGKKYLDYFPASLVKKTDNTKHWIEFWNNSRYYLIGTDKFDSLAGTPPDIVILDEYSLQDPDAYTLIFIPILAENDGIAIFAFTPRSKNHGYKIAEVAKANPKEWFYQLLTVNDTTREDGSPVVTDKAIEQAREQGMSEAKIAQEFYCSFEGAVDGAYYTEQIAKAEKDGRIGGVPYDSNFPVYTFWDLGSANPAIWFVQKVMKEIRVIDFYHGYHKTFDWYAAFLKEKGYSYFEHYMPHDVATHDMSAPGGKNRKEVAEGHGIKPIKTVERPMNRAAVMAGIEAVKSIFSQLYIDKVKCEYGLNALRGYHADVDENKQIIEESPVDDWCAHPSDALRILATSDFLEIKEDTPWKGLKSKGSWKN